MLLNDNRCKADQIEIITLEASIAKGMKKMYYLKKARLIMSSMGYADMQELCNNVHHYNQKQIKYLIGVGLKEPAQTVFLEQYLRLGNNL